MVTNYEQYSAFSGSPSEEWRDIVGYEGLYQVSSCGRVRALERTVSRGKYGLHVHKSRIMSPLDHGNGYLYISLSKNNKRKNYYIHRLVAEAFIANPDNKPQVNHKDHNRSNNGVANLEWVTCVENIRFSSHLFRHPRKNNKNTNKEYGTGIRLKNGKYEVYICHKYLGRYWELEDAQRERDKYVEEYYHEL
jgi:hypothetical protein